MYNLVLFGKEVYKIRKEWRLSRSKINELTGIGIETIRTIENGTRFPKIETLESLSHIYKCDLVQLLLKYRSTNNILNQDIIAFTSKHYNNWDIDGLEQAMRQYLENTDHAITSDEVDRVLDNYMAFFKHAKSNNMRFALTNATELEELLQLLCKNKKSIYDQPYLLAFELALSNIYALTLRQEDKIEESLQVLKICETILRKQPIKDPIIHNLYGAVLINIVTAYHRQNQHEEVLQLCNKVLRSDEAHFSKHILHGLLFRKIIALHLIDPVDFRIPHLITNLLENEEGERRATYAKIFKNQYNLEYAYYDHYLPITKDAPKG